jgi:undecaprenyl-diphosphatase
VLLSILVLVLGYAGLTVAVVIGSSLPDLDTAVLRWAPAAQWPALGPLMDWWVLLGQRAICLAIAVAVLLPRTLRDRDLRPLLTLGIATLLVNVTVGSVKHLLGRLGPLQLGPGALAPGGSEVFTDGTIFPSGHTANAVVTWGVLAVLARHHRRWAAALAVVLSVTVGLTTVYLGTHWVSDVLAGWVAGGLVLLAVHLCRPAVERSRRWPARRGQAAPERRVPAARGPAARGPAARGPAAWTPATGRAAAVQRTRPGAIAAGGRRRCGQGEAGGDASASAVARRITS